jgi:hypothetical protein
MSYALEPWATAELRDGRAERACQLYALAERGYQAGYRLWRTDAEEHRHVGRRAAGSSGRPVRKMCSPSRQIEDFNKAVGELIEEAEPVARRLLLTVEGQAPAPTPQLTK